MLWTYGLWGLLYFVFLGFLLLCLPGLHHLILGRIFHYCRFQHWDLRRPWRRSLDSPKPDRASCSSSGQRWLSIRLENEFPYFWRTKIYWLYGKLALYRVFIHIYDLSMFLNFRQIFKKFSRLQGSPFYSHHRRCRWLIRNCFTGFHITICVTLVVRVQPKIFIWQF